MSPVENNSVVKEGKHQIVSWDLDTTGRRLIDEICQIAGYYSLVGTDEGPTDSAFSQYVMPHKNPNPGARRSFGIKVHSIGRYRMLKDVETGKILKTKSEVSALQDFIAWLKEAKDKTESDGVILVCHEPARKTLVPLFLEALRRYNLLETFGEVVVAFANSATVVEKFADSDKVTSYSLRSLCKTILNNTNPATASACDRAKVLVEILSKVCGDEKTVIDAIKVASVASSVKTEHEEVQQLKSVLGTQGTLRPVFEGQLRKKRTVRERAIALRRLVAEAGLNYDNLAELYKTKANEDEKSEESRQKTMKAKISEASDTDIEDLVKLMDKHFINNTTTTSNLDKPESIKAEDGNEKETAAKTEEAKIVPIFEAVAAATVAASGDKKN
jgi:maternal-effect protein exuperantia